MKYAQTFDLYHFYFVFLFISLFIYLFIYSFIHLFVSLLLYFFIYSFIYLFVCLQAEAKVFISVLDRNDNSPVFTHAEYSGTVVESTGPGIVIAMVCCSFI